MRKCSKCHQEKPEICKGNYHCHACRKIAAQNVRDTHKKNGTTPTPLESSLVFTDDRQVWMYSAAKARAQKFDVPFDIIPTDIVIPEYCPVLGIKLFIHTGIGPRKNSPSLDRFIPALGYVKNNIAVISHRANTMKRQHLLEGVRSEMIRIFHLSEEWATLYEWMKTKTDDTTLNVKCDD
jgi:hypothetical protein